MKHILSSSAYLVVNKHLARIVGLNATVLLADLISKEHYFADRSELVEGMFFNTCKNIEKDTTLTEHLQKVAIKSLKDKGLITTKLMGMPAKTHFKIHESKILNLLQTSIGDCKELVSGKLVINKNKEIIINNKKNISIDDRESIFRYDVLKIDSDLSNVELLTSFLDYWTEPNPSNTKMRFELQKTFDVKRRLATWVKNSKKWDNKPTSKIDQQITEHQKAMDIVRNTNYEQ